VAALLRQKSGEKVNPNHHQAAKKGAGKNRPFKMANIVKLRNPFTPKSESRGKHDTNSDEKGFHGLFLFLSRRAAGFRTVRHKR